MPATGRLRQTNAGTRLVPVLIRLTCRTTHLTGWWPTRSRSSMRLETRVAVSISSATTGAARWLGVSHRPPRTDSCHSPFCRGPIPPRSEPPLTPRTVTRSIGPAIIVRSSATTRRPCYSTTMRHVSVSCSPVPVGVPPETVDDYVVVLGSPDALESALAWYRASPNLAAAIGIIDVPTMYIWGDADSNRRSHRS